MSWDAGYDSNGLAAVIFLGQREAEETEDTLYRKIVQADAGVLLGKWEGYHGRFGYLWGNV